MQAEDRLIHFSTEWFHPPVQHKVAALQKLYYELSQVRTAAYDSSDFSLPGQPKFHSRRGQRSQSIAVFLPDRVALIEEWADIPLSTFLEKCQEVSHRVLEVLQIPVFVAQSVTLRATLALTHFEDARVFLLEHVCCQEGRIGPYFSRPLATAGLRLVFPETPDHPGNLQITIEPYRHSRTEVFVEVRGMFTGLQIGRDTCDALRGNIVSVRSFITNHIFPYLNQYDVRAGDAV
ncbi:MAG: hypothetical protein HY706_21205 [Candidatus Hydrogenedentes bacterium]|nr:hypothetical protein [Candidatus Hydrogenedentota bacterium]